MSDDPYWSSLSDLISKAYAPYSNFPVAAIVRSASGALYPGVNVENAAYPQGWCAEASAIAAMVAAIAFLKTKKTLPTLGAGMASLYLVFWVQF